MYTTFSHLFAITLVTLLAATLNAHCATYTWSYQLGPTRVNGYSSSSSTNHVSLSRPLVPGREYYYSYPSPSHAAAAHPAPLFGHVYPPLGPIYHPPSFFRPLLAPVMPQYAPSRTSSPSLVSGSSSLAPVAGPSSLPVSPSSSADVSVTNSLRRPSNSRPVASPARRPMAPSRVRPNVLAAPASAPTPSPAPSSSTINDADLGFEVPSNSDSSSLGGSSNPAARVPPPAASRNEVRANAEPVDPSGFARSS